MTDKAPQKTEPFRPPLEVLEWYPDYYIRDADGRTIFAELTKDQANDLVARLSQPSAGVDAEKAALLSRISDLESALYAVRAVSMRRHDPSWNTVTDAVNIALKGNILSAAPKPTEHSGGDAEKQLTNQQIDEISLVAGRAVVKQMANKNVASDDAVYLAEIIAFALMVKYTGAAGHLKPHPAPTTPPSGDERAAAWAIVQDERFNIHGPRGVTQPTIATWIAAIIAKHTSGPHSPAPGLSEAVQTAARNLLAHIDRIAYRDGTHFRLDDNAPYVAALRAALPASTERERG